MEAAAVEKSVDTLADGEAAAVMLPFDLVEAAHQAGLPLALSELVELRLPVHQISLSVLLPHSFPEVTFRESGGSGPGGG